MELKQRSRLDQELSQLQANIVRLGSMVEVAIEQSMAALETKNLELARQVIDNDHEINVLRYEVEDKSLQILATQHPAAGDLRTVIAAIHIAVELERMGDHAVGISRLAKRLAALPKTDSLYQLPKMDRRVRKSLRLVIDAYVSGDLELVEQVTQRDQKINAGYEKLFSTAIEMMKNDDLYTPATYFLWIGHNLERIGDRVVNIAERIVFMTTGEFPEKETGTTDLVDD